MHLETIDFPSDLDSAFGALSRELCKALHMASEHPDHALLLDKFLKFSTKQLTVAKADFKSRAATLAKRAVARAEKEATDERLRLEGLYGKVSDEIDTLTTEKAGLAGALGITDVTDPDCDRED